MKQKNKIKMAHLKVPCGGKLVYHILVENADKHGEVAMPISEIAKSLGVAKSTVTKNIERLRRQGVIYVQPQYRQNGMRSINIYRIKDY